MKLFIGQSVIAVRDHSMNYYRQGDEFMVLDRLAPHCKCGYELISVGIPKRSKKGLQECGKCGTVFKTDGDVYFRADNFVPSVDVEIALNEIKEGVV